MIKIVKSKDCGNSPKNLLVQSLALAIEKVDQAEFAACVGDDICWVYPGRPLAKGASDASSQLRSQQSRVPTEIEVEHAISHGRVGAASGTVIFASGEKLRFCHFIEFTSIKGDRIGKVSSFYEEC